MKQLLSIICIILLFMSCLTGHSYSSAGFQSTFRETSSFSNYLVIKNSKEDINLNITVELQSGSCQFNIINPNNDLVESINITEIGKTEIKKSFKSIDGKWSLALESNNADGAFDLKWSNE